ncbi:hypothetical protein MBLNU459_g6175t1 [Dothideomycetes sp. NU459]
MLRPQFMNNRTQTVEQLQKHVEDLLAAIPDDEPVDLQQIFFRYTLDTTTSLLFGRSTESLTNTSTTAESSFANAFNVAQNYLAQRGRLGDLYWLIGGRKFRDACRRVHESVDSMIAEALLAKAERVEENKGTKLDYIFLDALIEETQPSRTPIYMSQHPACWSRHHGLLSLVGIVSALVIRLLARNPQAYRRLREEILGVVGGGRADSESRKHMPYLQLVLKEVLRLSGGPDGESPILVMKGEPVRYSPYALHRRKDLYGDDADHFRPERWEATDGDNLSKRIGWGYIPFNGGPRICLGQEFTLLEASLAIVRIVQKYDCLRAIDSTTKEDISADADDLTETGKEPQTLALVLSSAEGYWIRLRSSGPEHN